MAEAVTSRREISVVTPTDSPRSYRVAPLMQREKALFRAAMRAAGARFVSRLELLAAMREVLEEIAPDNLADLLAMIEEAENIPPDDRAGMIDAARRLVPIEDAVRTHPTYAALEAQTVLYDELLPLVLSAHALRGWDGPDLPPFRRVGGVVPDELLEAIPGRELAAITTRALEAFQITPAAEKNSAPPSPSSDPGENSTAA